MKKEKIKNIILIIVVSVISSTITSFATTNLPFNSNDVRYSNTESGVQAETVQGAIDELYSCASDYSTINNKIGSSTLATTNQTLTAAINELNTNFSSSQEYPKIYTVSGMIANEANNNEGGMVGTGIATVTLYANHTAKIQYYYVVTTAYSGSLINTYWGLNRDLLKNLNNDIPTITPIAGGTLIIFRNAQIMQNYTAYGGTNHESDNFWNPARVYTLAGNIGPWQSGLFVVGDAFYGTCYGTY